MLRNRGGAAVEEAAQVDPEYKDKWKITVKSCPRIHLQKAQVQAARESRHPAHRRKQ